ncbi:MAG: lipid A deacylase LpxR family protein, partial [Bacteroidales bacterium]|nr:lipid A deacylase LpxR family protein [Bacteroidales bacterium]
FFGQATGRFVAYNATLQGGLINKSNIHVFNKINHIVGEITTGFVFSYTNFSIELGQHLLSPEYYYGRYHKWGYLSIKFGF